MSNPLSTKYQDDTMTVTQASRPGAEDTAPAGVPTMTDPSSRQSDTSATSPDTSSIPGAWKSSAVAAGGLDATPQTASSEQQPASGVLSGASVQAGLHQAEETAYKAAEAVLGTVQSGLEYVQETVANHQKAQENKEIHEDGTNYIKEQLENKETETDKLTTLPIVDQSSIPEPTGQREEPKGFGIGILRDTIESSSAADVSYEHRPKTLPQSEITAREQERGIKEGADGTPARVQVSRVHGAWPAEASGSAEAVHEKSQVEHELLSKVGAAPVASEGVARVNDSRTSNNTAPTRAAEVSDIDEALREKSQVERELLNRVEAAPVTSEGVASGSESRTSGNTAPTVGGDVEVVGNWGSETARVLGSAAVASAAGAGISAANTIGQGATSGAQSQAPVQPLGDDPAYPHVGTSQTGFDGRPGQLDAVPSTAGAGINAGDTPQQGITAGTQSQLPDHPPGQDPSYPHVGTSQTGTDGRPGQSDSIPPVVIHTHGPEPGKGVAPIQGSDLDSAKEEVFGSSKPHEELGITPRGSVQEPPRDSIVAKDLGPASAATTSDPYAEEKQRKKSISSELPIRPADQSAARAGSVNPVETKAGEGLSAPPITSDDSIDDNTTRSATDDRPRSPNKTQPDSENPGQTFDASAHAAPEHSVTKDPGWSGKESVREHLRNDTKGGVRENPSAIPIAGGQKVGEAHWGESKKLE
ncbi:hypothetical protein CB0940_05330 [Cercospora beticola]|uniref:Uncharacterized protein n=1 Tax=Cercospora beticola TaxID=122368 RepID=A0A2G5I0P4_CERBT|nr:hypothetical protein CB0940_05330 [Cercospora beticola]PIA98072.1 hypothetical protein CB0940_05330 [Cercospora beticola]WPA97867.1 hypothetical protein RHO25_002478 [Cercospora beticola]CAK1359065.1 unnamed protein product [Cercospora beticola]